MIHWKKLLPYLLLNVFVSALTVLLVLFFWEQARGARSGSPADAPQASAPTAQATLPPLDEPLLKISIVIGAGDLQTEVVRIQRLGENDLSLLNWQLQDEDGQVYTFQDLLLLKNAEIKVYSRTGVQKSSTELYWGQTEPVWRHGEKASLVDPAGNVRAEYVIP